MVRPTILTPELLRRADEMQRRGITYPQIAEVFASEGAVVKAATLRVQVSKFRKGQLHGSSPLPPTPAPAPPPAPPPAPRAPRQRSPARKSELASLKEQVSRLQQQVEDLTQTEPAIRTKPTYFGSGWKSTTSQIILEALGDEELNYDQIGEATGLRTSQLRNTVKRLAERGIISKSTRLEWRGMRKHHVVYVKVIGEIPAREKPGRTRILEILADGKEHTRVQLAEATESTTEAIRAHIRDLVAKGKVEKTIRRVAERNTNIAFYRLIA